MFIYFWERVWVGEGQRERETQNPKQGPGSKLSTQSPTWGSNSGTVRSDLGWSRMLNQLSPQAPLSYCFYNWDNSQRVLSSLPAFLMRNGKLFFVSHLCTYNRSSDDHSISALPLSMVISHAPDSISLALEIMNQAVVESSHWSAGECSCFLRVAARGKREVNASGDTLRRWTEKNCSTWKFVSSLRVPPFLLDPSFTCSEFYIETWIHS